MTIEFRTIALIYDARMKLTSVGSTFVLLGGPYVASVRSRIAVCSSLTAVCSLNVVCSPLTVFILALGVVCLYFSFRWRLIEKLIGILSWNMIVAGTDYQFVSCLELSIFQYFLMCGVNWMNKRCWYCKDLSPSKCSPLRLVHVLSYGLH
ncbi:unnamed protein product [Brassica rapa]|uniref:Uncharacterized protein n=1 Tax=Brassica campestris TaxID=3711 RepID=A0A3P6B774_BRACM|nr:unnamed protein product [Brassica rapa]VDC96909.1 unnamed protein product [Brassica rapa]